MQCLWKNPHGTLWVIGWDKTSGLESYCFPLKRGGCYVLWWIRQHSYLSSEDIRNANKTGTFHSVDREALHFLVVRTLLWKLTALAHWQPGYGVQHAGCELSFPLSLVLPLHPMLESYHVTRPHFLRRGPFSQGRDVHTFAQPLDTVEAQCSLCY